MNTFDAIHERRSYRGRFSPEILHQGDLAQIVEAGIAAPSGKNRQTTEFVIIDDPDLLAKVRKMHEDNTAMKQAVAYIACIIDRDHEQSEEGLTFQVEDCAAAVENMLLAITALGYASVWVDGWLRFEGRAEAIGELIGLPKSKVIRVLLPVGIPAENLPHVDKKPFEERAWFNKYRS